MTFEDQVAGLFARANPVPSLDLLDPIETVDIDHLTARFERNSSKSGIRTVEPKVEETRQRPVAGMVAAAALAVLALGAVIALVGEEQEEAGTPIEVAQRYMAAINDHDTETVLSMLAEDVNLESGQIPTSVDYIPPTIELEELLEWTWDVQSCVDAEQSVVRCEYQWSNNISRALGVGPDRGEFQFTIEDGKVRGISGTYAGEYFVRDLVPFFQWVARNHPEAMENVYLDIENMYFHTETGSPSHYSDGANLTAWRQLVPEFLAEMEASG